MLILLIEVPTTQREREINLISSSFELNFLKVRECSLIRENVHSCNYEPITLVPNQFYFLYRLLISSEYL